MGKIIQVCAYNVGGVRFYDVTFGNGRTLTCTPSTISRFAVRFMENAKYKEEVGVMTVYREVA